MSMRFTNNPKEYKILGLIFLAVGVVAGAIALFAYAKIGSDLGSLAQAQATITAIDDERTTIRYSADERLIDKVLNEYNSAWRVGDTITVYFDRLDPMHVRTDMMRWLIPMILCINGGVFLILGSVFCYKDVSAKRKRRVMMESGTPLTAEITDILLNPRVRVYRRYPVRLQCRHTDSDGTTHVFKSHDVWTPFGEEVIGRSVTVYVDRSDMKKFYVDTDSIEGADNTVYHG